MRKCARRITKVRSLSLDANEKSTDIEGPENIFGPKMLGILFWSLIPSITIWIGLYQMKSAAWAYGIYHVVYLVPSIIVGRHLWLRTVRKPQLKHVLWIFVTALVFSLITVAAYEIAGHVVLSNKKVGALLLELGLTRGNLIVFGLYATFVNPIVEELYWRGVLFNELERVKIKHFALVWSSLAHAIFHYLIFRLVLFPIANEIGILMLAVYNGILAIIYRRSGSIITAAIAHGLLTDMACIWLILDFFRKNPNL